VPNFLRSVLKSEELKNLKDALSENKIPFSEPKICAEIILGERQKALRIQPMLYLCFPITELKNGKGFIGKKASSNASGYFVINKSNAGVFIQLLRLFGMLSGNHRRDVISIIDVILEKTKT
jgi:hypothetical protein